MPKTCLLDTNHASRLLKADDPLWERVRQAITAGDAVCIPMDVVEELQFGIEATRDPEQRRARNTALDGLLALFATPGISLVAARHAGRMRGRLRRQGQQLDAIDAHLAGMALESGDTVVTADQDFAPLAAEIAIENWLS